MSLSTVFYGLLFTLKRQVSFLFVLLSLLYTISHRANVVRVNLQDSTVQNSFKEVSGYIRSEGSLLSQVHVMVKNTDRQSFSDEKGYYMIEVAEGETIHFSHNGLKSVEVIVEDMTKVLNINLLPESRMLSEVKINASSNTIYESPSFETYFGKLNRRKMGYSNYYVKGENLNSAAVDIVAALDGKVPGYRYNNDGSGNRNAYLRDEKHPALWEIDGILFTDELPLINLSDVLEVNVIKSPAGLSRYGSLGRGGVIIVRTQSGMLKTAKMELAQSGESILNENIYKKDAVPIKSQSFLKPFYQTHLDSSSTPDSTFKAFEKLMPVYKEDATFYLDFFDQLNRQKPKNSYAQQVLAEMGNNLFYDPVSLKALAYTYETNGMQKEAFKVYQRIISLRPEYAQSYRDLANAYRRNLEIEKSWNYYMQYLHQVKKLDRVGIGGIIYHEMEEIIYRRPGSFVPTEKFVLKGDMKDVPKDFRILIEWDSSEAEFELEFVNPEGQAYSFLHNFEYNNEQIIDEKKKGYSSKEFYIDELNKNGWKVNITYSGNKTNKPTYLKVTSYRDWAKKNEAQNIKVFKLIEEDRKFNILQF